MTTHHTIELTTAELDALIVAARLIAEDPGMVGTYLTGAQGEALTWARRKLGASAASAHQPRVGRRFLHAHHVTPKPGGGSTPALCKITDLTKTDVYYRWGIEPDGSGGELWRISRAEFPTSVRAWLY